MPLWFTGSYLLARLASALFLFLSNSKLMYLVDFFSLIEQILNNKRPPIGICGPYDFLN